LEPLQLTSTLVELAVSNGGALIVCEVLAVQLRASLTVTLCRIALSPLKVVGEVATANAPPSKLTWYGPAPPPKVTVIAPSLEPLQLTSTLVELAVSNGGALIVCEVLAVQLRASLTVTLCRIALSPLKVVGEVATANAPPSRLTWYGPAPPPKVTVIEPS